MADERRAGLIPDTLVLLEHPHTYTIGRSGTRDHVFLNEEELAARGITCLDVDRGEDEDAGHAPRAEPAAFAASRLRSQAAYELPAAVSRPVNSRRAMSL